MMRQLAVCLFVLLWLDKYTLISCLSDDYGDDRNEKDEGITNDESSDPDDDSLYVRNPSYMEPSIADVQTPKSGSTDATETEFESVNMQASQGNSFNTTLAKDQRGSKRGSDEKAEFERLFGVSTKKRVSRFLKRHSVQITVALVLVAFRREIASLVGNVAYQSVKDPNTGRATKRLRVFDLKPTSILKMLVFVYILRRLQRSDILSPTTLLLLARLSGNPWLTFLLFGFMPRSNPAYIPPIEQHYTFERLNDRYSKDQQAYSKILGSNDGRFLERTKKSHETSQKVSITDLVPGLEFLRQESEPSGSYNGTIVVMDWTSLDIRVSRLDILRDEVSFLIDCYQERDDTAEKDENVGSENSFEVVVLLESPGGSASDYALAAQQIIRLRDQGVNVTVCVDKVAASGGYMIACCSSPGRLFAAPFALLGSIGVIGQTINIHKVLQGWGATPMVFRGGKDKAPVGLIGEVTKEGMDKVQLMVDDVHRAFKRHVVDSRPSLASRIEEIATGDTWLGYDALELGLVDQIITSDEYIAERIRNGSRVLKLYRIVREQGTFSRRTTTMASTLDPDPKPNLLGLLSFFPLLSEFNAFLGRLQEAIASLLADDFSPLTRSVGVRAPSPCGSM
jgi:ClpP class serine protease